MSETAELPSRVGVSCAIKELEKANGFFEEHRLAGQMALTEECLEAMKERIDAALALLKKERVPEELSKQDRERVYSVLMARCWDLEEKNPESARRLREVASRVKAVPFFQAESANDWAMIATTLIYIADKWPTLDGWTEAEAAQCRKIAEAMRDHLQRKDRV